MNRQKVLAVGLGFLAALIASPVLAQNSPAYVDQNSLHREVLTQRIDEVLRQQVLVEIFGTVDVALAGAGIALGAINWDRDRRFAVSLVAGFGLVEGAAVSSLFMTRDARSSILEGTIDAVPAIFSFGVAVARYPGSVPRLTAGSLAAGYATTGALRIVNRALTPTPYSQLRLRRARLDDPRDLSDQERRTLHESLLGARGPLPRWLIGLPLIIAGGVASVPLFDRSYSKDAQLIAGVGGGMTLLSGVFYLLPSSVDAYESDLQSLDISVAAVPGGLAFSGKF
jgi:hypothetical protein